MVSLLNKKLLLILSTLCIAQANSMVDVQEQKNLNASLLRESKENIPDPTPVMKRLIAVGANVNTKDEYGNTPLHNAVSRGNQKAINMLIRKHANINAQSNAGNTPLMLAMQKPAIVKILLEAGADPSIRNISKDTASDMPLLDWQSQKLMNQSRRLIEELGATTSGRE